MISANSNPQNVRAGRIIASTHWILLLLAVFAAGCSTVHPKDNLGWSASRMLTTFPAPAPVLDCVDLSPWGRSDIDLFASLEGIVNRTQPRIVCVSRRDRAGDFPWLKAHKLAYRMIDGYAALLKYRNSVTGLVVTDPWQPDTLNLATTIAGVKNELICDSTLLSSLTNAPYNFPIIDDLRDRFMDKYAVYDYLHSNYWSRCTHRIVAGMSPNSHGCLRDYLIAVKAATVWLGPGETNAARLLRLFVADMKPAHGVYMGWWPGEGDGLEWIAHYGIPVLASDFFENATVFSGVTGPVHIPEIPPPPPLENKVYVSLILSDGDNVQYMQHAMRRYWADPARGAVPIGWTASPLAVDLDPMMLDYYWTTATTNDCLVSGPSGAGYAHINHWGPATAKAFVKVSAPYLQRSGLRVITVWDRVTKPVARAFDDHCPTLLGLTSQGPAYTNATLNLPTIKLTPAYTSSVSNMIAGITKAAARWDGAAPLFIAAQADVWHLGPSDLVQVAHSLDPAKYTIVRPDQLFILARQERRLKR